MRAVARSVTTTRFEDGCRSVGDGFEALGVVKTKFEPEKPPESSTAEKFEVVATSR